MVKNPLANAGDVDSTPGSGRSPGEGNANHSSILAWEIPWTEESGGLQSMGSQRVGHDLATNNIFSATWPLMSPHIDVSQRGKKGERGLWTLTITVISQHSYNLRVYNNDSQHIAYYVLCVFEVLYLY